MKRAFRENDKKSRKKRRKIGEDPNDEYIPEEESDDDDDMELNMEHSDRVCECPIDKIKYKTYSAVACSNKFISYCCCPKCENFALLNSHIFRIGDLSTEVPVFFYFCHSCSEPVIVCPNCDIRIASKLNTKFLGKLKLNSPKLKEHLGKYLLTRKRSFKKKHNKECIQKCCKCNAPNFYSSCFTSFLDYKFMVKNFKLVLVGTTPFVARSNTSRIPITVPVVTSSIPPRGIHSIQESRPEEYSSNGQLIFSSNTQETSSNTHQENNFSSLHNIPNMEDDAEQRSLEVEGNEDFVPEITDDSYMFYSKSVDLLEKAEILQKVLDSDFVHRSIPSNDNNKLRLKLFDNQLLNDDHEFSKIPDECYFESETDVEQLCVEDESYLNLFSDYLSYAKTDDSKIRTNFGNYGNLETLVEFYELQTTSTYNLSKMKRRNQIHPNAYNYFPNSYQSLTDRLRENFLYDDPIYPKPEVNDQYIYSHSSHVVAEFDHSESNMSHHVVCCCISTFMKRIFSNQFYRSKLQFSLPSIRELDQLYDDNDGICSHIFHLNYVIEIIRNCLEDGVFPLLCAFYRDGFRIHYCGGKTLLPIHFIALQAEPSMIKDPFHNHYASLLVENCHPCEVKSGEQIVDNFLHLNSKKCILYDCSVDKFVKTVPVLIKGIADAKDSKYFQSLKGCQGNVDKYCGCCLTSKKDLFSPKSLGKDENEEELVNHRRTVEMAETEFKKYQDFHTIFLRYFRERVLKTFIIQNIANLSFLEQRLRDLTVKLCSLNPYGNSFCKIIYFQKEEDIPQCREKYRKKWGYKDIVTFCAISEELVDVQDAGVSLHIPSTNILLSMCRLVNRY